MGKVTSVKVTNSNGMVKYFAQLDQVGKLDSSDRIELEYAYNPHLLPSVPFSSEGMWRYRSLLPISGDILYPLTVGGTPLTAPPEIRSWIGIPSLWLKDETRSPTGSNKDRATALTLEHALHNGIRTVSCASKGNVAVSLAVGAAACGIEAIVFVPTDVRPVKLQLMLLAGAIVFKVAGGYERAVELSRLAAQTFGWYDRNTGYNPLTIEAKKTVALEIWEQLGHCAPDVVVVPVGDGATLNGIAKGFRELMACSAIDQLPRIIGVQAEGCQPLKIAWETNTPIQPQPGETIADGIAVTNPINARKAIEDIRDSRGAFVSISDSAIINGIHILAQKGGILAEPAGVAALIGAKVSLGMGLINKHERVVVLITGTGLKDFTYLQPEPEQEKRSYEISANIDDVKRIFGSL